FRQDRQRTRETRRRRSERGLREDAVVNDLAPAAIEGTRYVRAPFAEHDVVAAQARFAGEPCEDFDWRLAIRIQWRDQRLDDRERAIVRTPVAPRFEIVGHGYVPRRCLRRFIDVRPDVNRRTD